MPVHRCRGDDGAAHQTPRMHGKRRGSRSPRFHQQIAQAGDLHDRPRPKRPARRQRGKWCEYPDQERRIGCPRNRDVVTKSPSSILHFQRSRINIRARQQQPTRDVVMGEVVTDRPRRENTCHMHHAKQRQGQRQCVQRPAAADIFRSLSVWFQGMESSCLVLQPIKSNARTTRVLMLMKRREEFERRGPCCASAWQSSWGRPLPAPAQSATPFEPPHQNPRHRRSGSPSPTCRPRRD